MSGQMPNLKFSKPEWDVSQHGLIIQIIGISLARCLILRETGESKRDEIHD
jgi:hypothetical protein